MPTTIQTLPLAVVSDALPSLGVAEAAPPLQIAALMGRRLGRGDAVPVRTCAGWEAVRWGLLPPQPDARGRPVLTPLAHLRAETVFAKPVFTGLSRGVVALAWWEEAAGGDRARVTSRAASGMAVPVMWAMWTAPSGARHAHGALLTCPPGPDLSPGGRALVVLPAEDVVAWLRGGPTHAPHEKAGEAEVSNPKAEPDAASAPEVSDPGIVKFAESDRLPQIALSQPTSHSPVDAKTPLRVAHAEVAGFGASDLPLGPAPAGTLRWQVL